MSEITATKKGGYILFDNQYGEYRDMSNRNRTEFLEECADWWFDMNYDSERDDFEYLQEIGKYPKHLSEKEIFKIIRDKANKVSNFEYLTEHGFEAHRVIEEIYEIHTQYFIENPDKRRVSRFTLEAIQKEKYPEE